MGCSPEPTAKLQSKKPAAQDGHVAKLPFSITWIESDEEKEKQDIKEQAWSLFGAKDYAGLDALIRRHRESRECYASGFWKLNEVHTGLALPKKASDAKWADHLAALKDWAKASPQSVAARIKLAEELTSYGWRARGGGYAKTVTDKGWELFRTRLAESAQVLAKARQLDEKCPRLWSAMLQVALGLAMPRADYDKLFTEAVQAYPQYTAFYTRKANYLLPRWHGKPGEWEKFLGQAADEIGGDDGDVLYARVAWNTQDSPLRNVFKESAISWERVNRGLKILESRFPQSACVRNQRAYMACLAGDRDQARSQLTQLNGNADPSVWGSLDDFTENATWAFAE